MFQKQWSKAPIYRAKAGSNFLLIGGLAAIQWWHARCQPNKDTMIRGSHLRLIEATSKL
ncbi:hypothetical protein C1H46_003413 [Malus baccata]|uniref:Uncharacterized protein n=1 Tax=Malus baccata TaxID=106549 RepID=A0A540NIW6_MALBA|nr:hypothetical protein C1H46_003413 [Malus baccata]